MRNSKKYPEAWKVFIDCVRKWEEKDLEKYPEGWKYGIPNPKTPNEYLYKNCPGKLFMCFKGLFYSTNEILELRKFLWKLEMMEGKISKSEYQSNINFINRY